MTKDELHKVWPRLPLAVRQQWWAETDYGKHPERASKQTLAEMKRVANSPVVDKWPTPASFYTAAVVLLFLALAVVKTMADPLNAPTSRSESFWDRSGSFSGSTITYGNTGTSGANTTSGYDARGRFDGSAIRNSDGSTSFYDRSGHFTGSVTSTRQPR